MEECKVVKQLSLLSDSKRYLYYLIPFFNQSTSIPPLMTSLESYVLGK